MADLIDRQAALDAIKNSEFGKEYEAVESLPSAQPDVPDKNVGDMISRQAAIDGLYEMSSDIDHLCTLGDYVSFLESLSAQPEIVRCKDCRHNQNCDIQYHAQAGDMFFCAGAERRTYE